MPTCNVEKDIKNVNYSKNKKSLVQVNVGTEYPIIETTLCSHIE